MLLVKEFIKELMIRVENQVRMAQYKLLIQLFKDFLNKDRNCLKVMKLMFNNLCSKVKNSCKQKEHLENMDPAVLVIFVSQNFTYHIKKWQFLFSKEKLLKRVLI